jgi:hypothetical protein
MSIFFRNYQLEMSKFKENYKGGNFYLFIYLFSFCRRNLGASCFKPMYHCRVKYSIIDDIFVSYNLVEHYFSAVLPKKKKKKKTIENFVKGFISC